MVTSLRELVFFTPLTPTSSANPSSTSSPNRQTRPFLHVGVVLCVVLAILLPHNSQADNGGLQRRREFGHGGRYHEEVHKAPPVTDREDAEDYLQHFGYLNCSKGVTSMRRRKRQLALHELSEGDSEENDDKDDPCSDGEYTLALKRFQIAMALTMTGVLDEATKTAMMKGRCGNSDDILVEETIQEMEATDSREDLGSKLNQRNGAERLGHRRDYAAPTKSRIKRYAVEKTLVQSSQTPQVLDRVWKWLADKLHPGGRARDSSVGSDDEEEEEFEYLHSMPSQYTDDITGFDPMQAHGSEAHMHLVGEGDDDSYGEHDSLLTQLISPHKRKKRHIREEMLEEIRQVAVVNNKNRDGHTRRETRDISEYEELRKQGKVILDPLNPERTKRDLKWFLNESTISFNESTDQYNYQWNSKRVLLYKVKQFSDRIPMDSQCSIITLAFRMWAEVTNLDFIHRPDLGDRDIDVVIGFGIYDHFDCPLNFDGEGGVLAHSTFNSALSHSNIHIDNDENYKQNPSSKEGGIPLLVILVHEIGHALGLAHHKQVKSVMFPVLGISNKNFELTVYDRQAIQEIYGTCTGRFDAMFDWLHPRVINDKCNIPCKCAHRRWQYYSFFFRDRQYWLYLNGKSRPRYGDPKLISVLWRGIPNKIDAVVQILRTIICDNFNPPKEQNLIETLFFKDDQYYEYDDINDQVKENGTKYISDRFGPKAGGTESVPNNLDAVLFDPRDNHLYFFKDEWIWEVDPFLDPENGSCCEGDKHRFSDYFIFNETTVDKTLYNYTEIPSLDGNVDSVYLRWQIQTIFIFKDKFVWSASIRKNKTAFYPPGPLNVTFLGLWNQRWNYICAVNIMASSIHCDT